MLTVPISKFADMGFCELKLVHSLIDGARPRFRPCVAEGTRQHALSAREDAKKPYKEVSEKELLDSLRDEKTSVELPSESVRVRFEHRGTVFSGRIDKLMKEGRKVFVVDLKFGRGGGAFAGKYECQLLSYCKALRDGEVRFKGGGKGLAVFSGMELYYVIAEGGLHAGEPVPFEEARLLPRLRRFDALMRGEFERRELACGEPGKCALCEFGHLCTHRAF